MALLSLFTSENVRLESKGVITVTRKTVRFSRTVYQTHNISEISEGYVSIGLVPWGLLVMVSITGLVIGILGLFIYQADQNSIGSLVMLVGYGLVALGSAGFVWNLVDPKYYGLLITLNSGDKRLFVTQDMKGLKQVILTIYEFIETDSGAVYQISIKNSQVSGNFIQGSAQNVSFNTD